MTALANSNGLLILPRLRIQNANAISSPMTHGFPSITAFLGLMWALERKLDGKYPIGFDSVGVVCHDHEELVAASRYIKAFRLTRNPLDKNGNTTAIVEEGRIHLDITLVFGVSGAEVSQDKACRDAFAQTVADNVAQMRIAGGTVLPSIGSSPIARPALEPIAEDYMAAASQFRKLRRGWLPGFALVCRDDLLAGRLDHLRAKDKTASVLDAWLDLSRFNWMPQRGEGKPASEGGSEVPNAKIEWRHDRTEGWIVPIPIGYGALTQIYAPGLVANAREAHTPFRFVESLYSIGQWIGPHRLNSWRQLLWYGHVDEERGLYRACNDYVAAV